MTRSVMTIERFKAVLDSYGARSEAWPEAEHVAAMALIEVSADAKRMFEAAKALDQVLDMVPEPQPAGDTFLERLFEIPEIGRRQSQAAVKAGRAGLGRSGQVAVLSWFRPTGLAAQMTGLAAAGILGLMLGLSNFSTGPEAMEQIDASAYLFENPSLITDVELVD